MSPDSSMRTTLGVGSHRPLSALAYLRALSLILFLVACDNSFVMFGMCAYVRVHYARADVSCVRTRARMHMPGMFLFF
jgi:hypothetical protein